MAKKFSDLDATTSLGNGDLLALAQVDGDAATGYTSKKIIGANVAKAIVSDFEYPTALPSFEDQTITGGMEELKAETNDVLSNLIKTTGTENEQPYQLRATPSNIGNLCLEKLVGVSCAFNQLVIYPDFSSGVNCPNGTYTVSDNVITITANGNGNTYLLLTADDIPANHVVYIACNVKLASTNVNDYAQSVLNISWSSGYKNINNANKGTWGILGAIVKPTANVSSFSIYPFGTSATSSDEKVDIEKPQIIDLTQMFGSEIADYLYTLESGTAGAGVQKFKDIGFNADYYPYTLPTIKSSMPTSKVVMGKNYVNSEGYLSNYWNIYGVINFLKPNTTYTYSVNGTTAIRYSVWLSNDGTTTQTTRQICAYIPSGSSVTFTTPADMTEGWLLFGGQSSAGSNINFNDVLPQIEFGSTATAYEPYTSTTYPLGGDELRGLFKKDADGNIYADGDVYNADGSIDVRYEERVYQAGDESLPNAITDGTNTVVKLATPTSSSSLAYDNPQMVGATEEFTDTRTIKMPCGHDTIYAKKTDYRYWE